MAKQWTWALPGSVLKFDPRWTIEVCQQCGVYALEYNHRGVTGMSEEQLTDLRKRYNDAGITINSFHLPFTSKDDIASFYEVQRRAAVDEMNHWIRVAGLLGAQVVVQHPTTNRDPAEKNGLETYYGQLKKSLETMLPVAREAGVVIGLENMTPASGGRFFSEADHIDHIRHAVDDPHLGFVYDTGHALLSAGDRALDILEAMGDKVVAWHLADNPGDRDAHLAPGRGEVNWEGVFQFAARINFSAPMTMETPPWGPGPDYSVETWKKSIDMLDDLARRATS